MNRYLRLAALAVALVLVMLLCCGCDMTSRKTGEAAYARTAWKTTGRTDVPASISCIHYNEVELLNSHMTMAENSVTVLPVCGYAYVFGPSGAGYDGLWAVFVDDAGNVIASLSYDALYEGYMALGDESPLQKAAYLNACNYLAFMYNEGLDNAAPLGEDVKMNQWYRFSADQIKAAAKR